VNPIDLHTHSCYSDGLLTPRELCAQALKRHVKVLALCDHDTLDGLMPMAEAVTECEQEGETLRSIPAVELSAGNDGHIHILGYGVDMANELLRNALVGIRTQRRERRNEMLQALRKLGIELPLGLLPPDDAQGMPVGRAHFARALVAVGVVNTLEQAFNRYLSEGRPAYVPLPRWSAAEAVKLLVNARAVPVLAHPMRTGLEPQMLEALVQSLKEAGLRGIEAFHPSASVAQARMLCGMARRMELLVTGGSDFHGDRGSHAQLGGFPAGWREWESDLKALDEAIARACGQP
jgi:3',5'-nucleoside bisphosphate phosphatase